MVYVNDGTLMLGSSIISTIITHPFDNLKVKKQTNIKINYECTYSNMKLLYTGMLYHIQSKPLFWGLTYTLKGNISNNKYYDLLLSANISSLLTNPLFVLKTKKETNNYSPISIRNMFNGYPITILRNTKLCAELMLIEELTEYHNINYGLSAFIVKLFSNSITYPLDTIATINRTTNVSILNIIFVKKMKLYSGIMFYNLFSVVNYALLFTIFDFFKKLNFTTTVKHL